MRRGNSGAKRLWNRLASSQRIADAYYFAREILGLGLHSEREIYSRLSRLARKTPRHRPGEFHFPFGTLHYIDALSLQYQYLEIFLERGYEFACDHSAPFIVDCGGNVGLSVIWFKLRYPQSRIIVFEADPAIARILKSNVSSLKLKDVEVIEAAVWDKTETVSFAAEGVDGGRIEEGSDRQQVRAVRLNDYIDQPVDLLKMDIEGAEYAVLSDLCRTGRVSQVERLACEVHSWKKTRPQLSRLLMDLEQNGFQFSFNHARSGPDLPGEAEPTPFTAAPDGKCYLHLYAWR